VLLIRRIRELLYDQGFTISGARNQLTDLHLSSRGNADVGGPGSGDMAMMVDEPELDAGDDTGPLPVPEVLELAPSQLRAELLSIRELLLAEG
jgi:hypothetical protein